MHQPIKPAPQEERDPTKLQPITWGFYGRYHPVKAWRQPQDIFGIRAKPSENLEMKDLKADYAFDIAMLLYPPTGNGKHIDNLCNVIDIDASDLSSLPLHQQTNIDALRKKNFAKILKSILWKQIESMALPHAKQLCAKMAKHTCDLEQNYESPIKKKRCYDPLAAAELASPVNTNKKEDDIPSSLATPLQTPKQIIQQENDFYNSAIKDTKAKLVRGDIDCLKWWDCHANNMPCLRMVINSLLGMFSGSGGLELDIGSFRDITSKQGSLSPGLVEVQLMPAINKHLVTLETEKIPKFGKDGKVIFQNNLIFLMSIWRTEELVMMVILRMTMSILEAVCYYDSHDALSVFNLLFKKYY